MSISQPARPASLSQGVDQASSTTSIGSSVNPSAFGGTVTFTATVAAVAPGSGTPSGTIEFFDGATSLGSATLGGSWTGNLQSARRSVLARIRSRPSTAGMSNFAASTSASISQVVDQSSSTTSISSSANPSVFGGTVTFTGTVAEVAPGSGNPDGHAGVLGRGDQSGERDAGWQRPGDLQYLVAQRWHAFDHGRLRRGC